MSRVKPRNWRIESLDRPKGRYQVLRAGRGHDRISISLKYVSDEAAQRALERVREEDAAGTLHRVLALRERDPKGAVRFLCGDPGIEEVFGRRPPSYGLWTLQRYYDEVYERWRSGHRPRSWRAEEGHWRRILRALGEKRLKDIDEFVVADYLDGLVVERGKRTGSAASGATKRLHRAALQAMLKRAYRQRHIRELPDLARFKIEGSTRRVREKPDPLDLDELVALMEASSPMHRCVWAVGGGQGLRPSELMRLDWPDVRWERRTLMIRGDARHGGKTAASVAEIPLTPIAFRELRAWWVKCGQPEEGPLFTWRDERLGSYKTAIKKAAKRAGIRREIYPYLLRDSFATIAWSLGIPMDVARRVLRHTDDTMLRKVYCRPRPVDLVEKVAAFDLQGAG